MAHSNHIFSSFLKITLVASAIHLASVAQSNMRSLDIGSSSAIDKIEAPNSDGPFPNIDFNLSEGMREGESSLPGVKSPDFTQQCFSDLKQFPGVDSASLLHKACQKIQSLEVCRSVKGHPILHYDKTGDGKTPQRILVFSLIHGDEVSAGSLGRFWMERLEEIVPRNSWRVVPILNPDGVGRRTRTNANNIDLNRNFPTQDWEHEAISDWKKNNKSNPRRFPGSKPGSEPEVLCAMEHIAGFKPDFIVSIHTPLNALDYDGPKIHPPKFDYLPWKNLGTFPGSLGRYMWKERQIPVLTTEMREEIPQTNKPFVQLQDIIGWLVSLDLGPAKK